MIPCIIIAFSTTTCYYYYLPLIEIWNQVDYLYTWDYGYIPLWKINYCFLSPILSESWHVNVTIYVCGMPYAWRIVRSPQNWLWMSICGMRTWIGNQNHAHYPHWRIAQLSQSCLGSSPTPTPTPTNGES